MAGHTTKVWFATRIAIGWVFLWAFFDKLIGLGFTTCRNSETGVIEMFCQKAWLSGGSPTTGYLSHAEGTFGSVFQAIAGLSIVDWLFMLGLLGIGVSLILGIAMNLGTYSGATMLMFMWLASLPMEHAPFVDDHLVYALVLLLLNWYAAGDKLGLGKWWKSQSFVKGRMWLH